jgi:hypothetical protein
MPTCANEDAKGSVANSNPAKIKERSFIMFVVLIRNQTQINQVHQESTK